MTPEEINIAIAEHCGWTEIITTPSDPQSPKGRECAGANWGKPIPNYHGDLNAMHEAHKNLNRHHRRCFLAHIMNATGIFPWAKTLDNAATRLAFVNLINATAAERAEAFLRTVGKWKEGA